MNPKRASLLSGNTSIIIDSGVHLGRVEYPRHASPRNLPDIFRKAKCAVCLEEDNEISRNHALILNDGTNWVLYDLNSLNGTFVNSRKLHKGGFVMLKDGDSVTIGKQSFRFQDGTEISNVALLTGNSGFFPKLKGVENDVLSMRKALLLRDFADGNISVFLDADSKAKSIISKIRSLAPILCEDSLFVFYYSGHGSRDGFCTYHSELSPKALYESFENLRGKKLVILDCCHSSIFLDCGLPKGTLIISGETNKGRLMEGPVSAVIFQPTKFIGSYDQRRGFLTQALLRLFENNLGEIDLKRIERQLEDDFRLHYYGVDVFNAGVTIMFRPMDIK